MNHVRKSFTTRYQKLLTLVLPGWRLAGEDPHTVQRRLSKEEAHSKLCMVTISGRVQWVAALGDALGGKSALHCLMHCHMV